MEPEKLAIKHHYKIAAYITAYEDPEAVKRCVAAINSQLFPVHKILIVDNSLQNFLVNEAFNVQNVIIKPCPENIGISGGLRLALEWASNEGYDFLWTFDQDSRVEKDCLTQLLVAYETLHRSEYSVGIIAPTAIDPRTNQMIEGAEFVRDRFIGHKPPSSSYAYECISPITSGSLISLAAAKTIAPPRADLFIDGVDLDYGLRLSRKGFHNLIVPQAIMAHNFGSPVKVKLLNRPISFQKYSALRHYYICRNHTYLATRYAQGLYRLTGCLRRIKYLIHTLLLIGLFDPENKLTKGWACLIGTFHGIQGKLGKVW